MKKIALLFILNLTLIPSFIFAESAPQKTDKELKLGAVLSLSGMASAHGNAIRDGLEFAKSELEKDGWKISINYQDDASEPRKTVTATRQLTVSGYKFFVGPTWGMLAIPTAQIFDKAPALSIQPCNSSDFVGKASDNFFFHFTPPTTAGDVMSKFVKEQKPKRIAILNNISDWGELWRKLFENVAKASGGELVRTDMIQFSDIDLALPTLMNRYKNEKIDFILSSTSKESTALTIAALEKLKHSATILSPDLVDSITEKLTDAQSDFVKGYTVTPIQSAEFVKKFTEVHGRAPYKYTDSGYDSLITLADAVQQVGSDPMKVKEYFLNTLDREGASGRIKFDANHDIPGRGYEIIKLVG